MSFVHEVNDSVSVEVQGMDQEKQNNTGEKR